MDLFTPLLGFIEGFGLIISPCILPILPIILASSLTGSKKRPIGVIIGFILSFSLFSFFSRQLVQITGIDLNWVRNFSYLLLLIFGLILYSSFLNHKFNEFIESIIQKKPFSTLLKIPSTSQKGFYNGVVLGSLIALIWTPCAGPILAAIIVQIVLQKSTTMSFLVLLAFSLGAAMPMFIIVIYGRKIVTAFPIFKDKTALFQKILAVVIIASVIFMVYSENANTIPNNLPQTTIKTATSLQGGLWYPYDTPNIEGIETWINSPPLDLNTLKNKVILIDFWTYSCINCIRTLPYLKDWYEKYHDKGLVIIGVHAPEFDFEKNSDNVKAAVKRYGITYPIALDNQFTTWTNFKNNYWPAHYLINKDGKLVYEHFGEGRFGVTENNIRYLLGIDDLRLIRQYNEMPYNYSQTPETYLGYARRDENVSPNLISDQKAAYTYAHELAINAWELQGDWVSEANKLISASPDAKLRIHFNAAKVYMVMGNQTSTPIKVNISQNGRDIKTIQVTHYTIYKVIDREQVKNGVLQITASKPGLEIYTFTFGN